MRYRDPILDECEFAVPIVFSDLIELAKCKITGKFCNLNSCPIKMGR